MGIPWQTGSTRPRSGVGLGRESEVDVYGIARGDRRALKSRGLEAPLPDGLDRLLRQTHRQALHDLRVEDVAVGGDDQLEDDGALNPGLASLRRIEGGGVVENARPDDVGAELKRGLGVELAETVVHGGS